MRQHLSVTLLAVMMFGLVACASTVENAGYVFNDDALMQVEAGKTSQSQVRQLLGSPSSRSTFGEERWHYFTRVVEHSGVLDPDVIEQQVVTIAFDDNGTVTTVETRSLEDIQEIEATQRTTPTRGRSFSVIEQLIGNFGRFNNQVDAASQ